MMTLASDSRYLTVWNSFLEHLSYEIPNVKLYSLQDADDQTHSLHSNVILLVQCHGNNAILELAGEKFQLAF